jgi:hypothetical protein
MSWVNWSALWKILVFGLIAGAGLPALFAGGFTRCRSARTGRGRRRPPPTAAATPTCSSAAAWRAW